MRPWAARGATKRKPGPRSVYFPTALPGTSGSRANQRPELWGLYNTRMAPGETMRVFPLSNWTELDVWTYIHAENIPIVPLYYAAPRPIVRRSGMLIFRDDDRMKLKSGEKTEELWVRFRTMGDWPLTAAHESRAESIDEVIAEIRSSRVSERAGRLIDQDQDASMERKKERATSDGLFG